jgi:hypothetical protein
MSVTSLMRVALNTSLESVPRGHRTLLTTTATPIVSCQRHATLPSRRAKRLRPRLLSTAIRFLALYAQEEPSIAQQEKQ